MEQSADMGYNLKSVLMVLRRANYFVIKLWKCETLDLFHGLHCPRPFYYDFDMSLGKVIILSSKMSSGINAYNCSVNLCRGENLACLRNFD